MVPHIERYERDLADPTLPADDARTASVRIPCRDMVGSLYGCRYLMSPAYVRNPDDVMAPKNRPMSESRVSA